MTLKTIISLFKNNQFFLLLTLLGKIKSFYKLCFLASAKNNGILELLSDKSLTFRQLAEFYCQDAETEDAFQAWVQLGVRLKLLKVDKQGYSLNGLAKNLSFRHNDALIAFTQEVTMLHYNLIFKTPEKIKKSSLWRLEDQHGEIVARSSRTLQPFQIEAIDKTFPSLGPVRLLEIGCGSAFYIYYAARNNPLLSALGIELQQKVADMARRNLEAWGLNDRVEIEVCDIRDKEPDEYFDIATLFNNIYYFPYHERVAFLCHIKKFLKPSGLFLLTTSCQGGNIGIELLNLYGASTIGCGRLASVDEMVDQLNEAGYENIKAISLIPGDKFYAFRANKSAC